MTVSYHAPRKQQLKPSRTRLILWLVGVVLLSCVGLLLGQYLTSEPSQPEPVAVEAELGPRREVLLYFASPDGLILMAEARTIADCQIDEECLRDTIHELLAGPRSGLSPILPAQARLQGLSVEASVVTIDFSREFVSGHPGGTRSELLTTYGLVNTLTVNFPHLRQMQILVEGAPVDTLKGHVDLRQPINPDFSLVEEGLAPAGQIINLPTGREE